MHCSGGKLRLNFLLSVLERDVSSLSLCCSFENANIMTERGGGDTFSLTEFTLDAGYFLDGNFTGKSDSGQEYGFSGILCYEVTGGACACS